MLGDRICRELLEGGKFVESLDNNLVKHDSVIHNSSTCKQGVTTGLVCTHLNKFGELSWKIGDLDQGI
jgi:hypothetical protein